MNEALAFDGGGGIGLGSGMCDIQLLRATFFRNREIFIWGKLACMFLIA